MDDDFDFTKPQALTPAAKPAAPANPAPASAPFKPAVSQFYDPVVAMRLFKAAGSSEKFAAGETLFVENERSGKQGLFGKKVVHRMYLIVSGEVVLTAGGKALDTIKAGEIFGEMAVIGQTAAGSARSATATAKNEVAALTLDIEQLQGALQKTPEFALMLMSVMFDRLRFVAARLAMRKVAPGTATAREAAVFPPEMLSQLDDALQHAARVRYDAGKVIMREGEAGVCMYVVMKGRVAIAIRDKIVEMINPGGTFGEMALVDQSPRTATAGASEDCELLSVNRQALLDVVRRQPEIGIAMMRSIADRLRHMNSLVG